GRVPACGGGPPGTPGRPPRERALGAGLAFLWFVACYGPFHARLSPGTPLLDGAQVTAAGHGLPLRIPAAGRSAVDLVLEGQLAESPSGSAAPPVNYSLTLESAGGPRVIKGTFEDRLSTRRLGRRGTATVHQRHSADVRVLANPGRGDLTVTHVVLEPESAQPITVSAYPHRLPGRLVLGLLAAALTVGVGLILLLGVLADGRKLLHTAAGIHPAMLAAPVLLTLASYAAMSRSYQGIAEAAGCRLSFRTWLRITFVSNTVNYLVTSAGLSGFAARMYLLSQPRIPAGRAVLISPVQPSLTNFT